MRQCTCECWGCQRNTQHCGDSPIHYCPGQEAIDEANIFAAPKERWSFYCIVCGKGIATAHAAPGGWHCYECVKREDVFAHMLRMLAIARTSDDPRMKAVLRDYDRGESIQAAYQEMTDLRNKYNAAINSQIHVCAGCYKLSIEEASVKLREDNDINCNACWNKKVRITRDPHGPAMNHGHDYRQSTSMIASCSRCLCLRSSPKADKPCPG